MNIDEIFLNFLPYSSLLIFAAIAMVAYSIYQKPNHSISPSLRIHSRFLHELNVTIIQNGFLLYALITYFAIGVIFCFAFSYLDSSDPSSLRNIQLNYFWLPHAVLFIGVLIVILVLLLALFERQLRRRQ